MKRRNLAILKVMALLVISFSIVSGYDILKANSDNLGGSFFDDLESFDESNWHKAHNWSNGQMFNATWYDTQVTFENSIMSLAIEMDEEGANPPYKAGEYRSNAFYQYGLFEVNMKPAVGSGTVSSFFTYTGPSNDDPWDEIDIEFLGKDTSKIQFNYFTDGVGNNEYTHDLGFDASSEFNTYAFEWRPDSISWYVNGELIYTATDNIPQTPQQIMMNLWPSIGVDSWTGPFNEENIPLYAQYNWIRYTPLSELDNANDEPADNEEDTSNEESTDGSNDNDENEADENGSTDDTNNNDTNESGDDESTVGSDDNNTDETDNNETDELQSTEDQSGENESTEEAAGTNNNMNGSTDIDSNINRVSEDSTEVEKSDKMNNDSIGNRLPDTATPIYTYLLVGITILLIGGYLFKRSAKYRNS
ncbi:beta-glucanase (GH16 family) [Gracilibacillus halotolerans]|uniref:Beta-glucanase n=1 Tax=Gracilibacillus halotolerans TaxID=74386 RepID=A0A841RQW3_9BACI|nr:glycoside hydrolase family 16 protein [Gracilibacillus halotolerans]MBB6513018.1 beta-glucanase (GH16 family) [Gracilibacillus halotolerans]